jgi:epoxyqueuosine reductase QueG
MRNTSDILTDIGKTLETCPDILSGISNISFSDYMTDYDCALVIAVPHSRRTELRVYNEEAFEALIHDARQRSITVINEIATVLDRDGVRYSIPPPAQTNVEELTALFSFKYAAVNAGLGWIGKNDGLITDRYGPEVTLNAILIDCDLPTGTPAGESKCPPECDLCIKACPYHALSDSLWGVGSKRSELIDYQLCNQKRSLYKAAHNRKHACGLCMTACPVGLD